MINSFIVPEDKEVFVTTWRGQIAHFVAAPGFIETKLHRNTGPRGRIRVGIRGRAIDRKVR